MMQVIVEKFANFAFLKKYCLYGIDLFQYDFARLIITSDMIYCDMEPL